MAHENDTDYGPLTGLLVHQPLYIVGSAFLWHFASRHSSQTMVAPLISAITPRWNATEAPEGLTCQSPCPCCSSCEGSNHSLRSAPCHGD